MNLILFSALLSLVFFSNISDLLPDALLYGRLFLPRSTLEALYLRRLTPTAQLKLSCVSDSRLPNGGTILALLQQDCGKYSTEYLYSTDSALLGVRGLYNFGPDPRSATAPVTASVKDSVTADAVDTFTPPISQETSITTLPLPYRQPHGRFSAGAEFYYGLLNKSGGISTGFRFTTLPAHTGFPYTMTLTLNPLMGNLSSTYSVLASPLLALSSRFDFNVYSYESELHLGMELWRLKSRENKREDLDWISKKLGRPQRIVPPYDDDGVAGVLKARVDVQGGGVGLMWEGRVKELLYSCGVMVDLRGGEKMMRGFGVEIGYSS